MPPFGRVLLGLALCFNAVGGEGGGGGSGGAAGGTQGGAGGSTGAAGGTSGQTSTAGSTTQQPTFDAAKAKAEARAAALKDLGFDDEDTYKAHLDEKKKADDARLTEAQKQKKLYDDAQDARGKAETRADKYKAEADDLRAQISMRDRLDNAGVTPSERKFAEVALRDAEAEEKKAGRTFDEAKFFEKLRADRPYFFAPAGAQTANTALRTTTAPANGSNGSNGSNGNLQFDASKLSDEEWRKWRLENT